MLKLKLKGAAIAAMLAVGTLTTGAVSSAESMTSASKCYWVYDECAGRWVLVCPGAQSRTTQRWGGCGDGWW